MSQGVETIDFGIDLGTTNSCIAQLEGVHPRIIPNNEGGELTPSVVWIDPAGNLVVGRQAKQQLFFDPENAAAEFKWFMGTSAEVTFARSGRRMKAYELSAEILKSLRADVQRETGRILTAAVVTVPADFDLPQCEATRQAAKLAGFSQVVLLQEPIAAGLAYGFDKLEGDSYWLVYDLGGGTFDAAIIAVRDGMLRVINHAGDKHLGGKLIDLDIVLKIFVPQLVKEHHLPDFTVDNPRWRSAFAKLKYAAEEAKIGLSSREEVSVHIPQLDRKLDIEFACTVSRKAVADLAMPYLLRTVNICRQALEQSHLRPQDLDAVVLVGGPSKMPILRELLADPKEGLGVRLEHRINPLTVVAYGAAMFAGTQILSSSTQGAAALSPGRFQLELDYKPIGPDDMPVVKGRVVAPQGQSLEGWSLEFCNVTSDISWRSGKIPIGRQNAFFAVLWAERGKRNEFRIELHDPQGVVHTVVPDLIPYTIAAVASQPPLTHSVGLALADGSVAVLCRKGTPLPVRKEDVRRTTITLRRGESGKLIAIPLVEGENRLHAHRNRLIGTLEIPACEVEQDVPWGSEVKIVVEIDASRLVTARAYVPLLQRSFEKVIHLQAEVPDLATIRSELEKEKARLGRLMETLKTAGYPDRSLDILARLQREKLVHLAEQAVAGAGSDPSATYSAWTRVLELKAVIDDLEEIAEWPNLVREAEEAIKEAHELVAKLGPGEHLAKLAELEGQIRDAIESGDREELQTRLKALRQTTFDRLAEEPGFWLAVLEDWLAPRLKSASAPAKAQSLFEKAKSAVSCRELGTARHLIREILELLPDEDRASNPFRAHII